ncbi:2OG-Fe dioxygenase family protein [Streptomyces cacaoi]|uniref:2OG-Fe dioxygenase family protein n=1 Tax=Streptomyces cacaoi TaxID=1898 RepID=UPI002628BE05|nr:2OG-Fe dioxygenase family protein [Streptomyces cacaoi]
MGDDDLASLAADGPRPHTVPRDRATRAPAGAPHGGGLDGPAGHLRHRGFARFHAAELGVDPDARTDDLQQIADVCARLPRDPYAPDSNRFRRYSHAVFLPWTDQLSFVPGAPDAEHGTVTEYWQDEHNPEYPNMRRRLPDVPAALRENALLLDLMRADLAQALWLEELHHAPVYVGVHLIKLAVGDRTDAAVPSPNCLHQDGGSPATFTFAHLIGCADISGGENVIARASAAGRQPEDLPDDAVLARFTLTEPLDGYAVHDHRVSHYVGPVRLAGRAHSGQRSILIIGIAPYAPRM